MFAAASHNHDLAYYTRAAADAAFASLSHNHDADYAGIGHSHDSSYSVLGHLHDSAYINDDAGEVDDADIADGAISAAKINSSGLDADTVDGLEADDLVKRYTPSLDLAEIGQLKWYKPQLIFVGLNPIGVAFDGTDIWVANSGSNNVARLNN